MRLFVTGGSRGIGARIVRDAVAAGHDVAFTYRSGADEAAVLVAEAEASGRICRAYRLDVRDPDAVDAVAEAAIGDLGGVDLVVCNAAVNRIGLAMTLSTEDWREVMDTNLSGAFYVCRAFLPEFLAEGRGRFVLVSSVGMHGTAGQIAYSASKAGLLGLSNTLAKEYGPKGITSNVLLLGLFDTDLSAATASADLRAFWNAHCPARRTGRLEEVAQTVLFLASDGAAFINGQAIGISGGLEWVP